ncbi:class 1 fructose-bisphosphatase [Halomicrobium salinisoli]|uniref:class 1 fructose-bisphosphatase n=1 Tax=Halomicrobium salinisoli TaxID=2878391 RepID=UPI001CF04865|nr:class 1 fructose-bisphosphatase [Halomicrobium salinisoli]
MSKTIDLSVGSTDRTVNEIVDTVARSTPEIRTAIANHRDAIDGYNPTGDEQLAADVEADQILEERLLAIDGVATYASEERETIATTDGRLHVAVDPLDGSSNLEPNAPMGTIFGVYDVRPPTPGRNLVAAGYVVYGPVTSMVVARDDTVREYVIHDGESRVVDDDVTLPEDPTIYGFGGGDDAWREPFAEFADDARDELKLRYGGSMVADINQVLSYGGVFSYPALADRPKGKLRIQFEGQPMGYVVEAAGGRSSDGERSLLDVGTTGLHQRTPIHLGNPDLIDRLEARLD